MSVKNFACALLTSAALASVSAAPAFAQDTGPTVTVTGGELGAQGVSTAVNTAMTTAAAQGIVGVSSIAIAVTGSILLITIVGNDGSSTTTSTSVSTTSS